MSHRLYFLSKWPVHYKIHTKSTWLIKTLSRWAIANNQSVQIWNSSNNCTNAAVILPIQWKWVCIGDKIALATVWRQHPSFSRIMQHSSGLKLIFAAVQRLGHTLFRSSALLYTMNGERRRRALVIIERTQMSTV